MWPQQLKEDPREFCIGRSLCRRSYCSPCPASKQSNYYWRDYVDGQILCDALQGPDGKLIGQVNYGGQILPAHFCPVKRLAIAERAGKQTVNTNIKILCTPNPDKFTWEPIEFNRVTDEQMQNAVKGGSQDNYDLFIGATFHDNEWKIGKVVPKTNPFKGLQVWDKHGSCAIIRSFHIVKFSSDAGQSNYSTVCYC